MRSRRMQRGFQSLLGESGKMCFCMFLALHSFSRRVCALWSSSSKCSFHVWDRNMSTTGLLRHKDLLYVKKRYLKVSRVRVLRDDRVRHPSNLYTGAIQSRNLAHIFTLGQDHSRVAGLRVEAQSWEQGSSNMNRKSQIFWGHFLKCTLM